MQKAKRSTMKLLIYMWLGFVFSVTTFASPFSDPLIEKVKKGVVSINTRIHKAAYNHPWDGSGSGFLVSKEKGLLITNRHVIGSASLARYEVTFFNGKQVDAFLYYYDPIFDFAVLRVDPKLIPENAQELVLKPEEAVVNRDVFIIGKNAGQDFSFQTGRVTSLFETSGLYPAQSMRINVNNRGGSSGSAVFNQKGEVIGLIHSSNMDSYGFALWVGYLMKPLAALQSEKKPVRRSLGASWAYYSVDRAVRYLHFPEAMAEEYMRRFPESRNQMIVVQTTLRHSPARKILKPGDLIWSVNGNIVGPHISSIEEACDDNAQETVSLEIVRGGKRMQISLKPYDILHHQISRMISFSGAHFYESDELMHYLIGVRPGTIMVSYVQPGSGLHQRFNSVPGLDLAFVQVTGMNGISIRSFKDLRKAVKNLQGKRYFDIQHKNFGVWVEYDRWPILSRPPLLSEGDIHPTDGPPILHVLNPNTGDWMSKPLWKPSPEASSDFGFLMQNQVHSAF